MSKGKLSFAQERCKGCSLCVSVCPMHVLELDQTKVNVKGYHPVYEALKDKCIACTSCALMCPDSIITIEKID